MSEELLRALMQFFAIITKQDGGGGTNEREYVKHFLESQLADDDVHAYLALYDDQAGFVNGLPVVDEKAVKLTSVKDSVKILGICKKINKTLSQKQKVVVLVRLYELINSDKKFSPQRIAIIDTAVEVFNISAEEHATIKQLVTEDDITKFDDANFLLINESNLTNNSCKFMPTEELAGEIIILQVPSAQLYFLRYTGTQDVYISTQAVNNKRIYLFAAGTTIKIPLGKPIFYSDVLACYMSDSVLTPVSFNAYDLGYTFKTGNVGLHHINISESQGRLVGIMGASGAGKTTLLNVLAGLEKPSSGKILINGVDLITEKEKLKGIIGYIPQDDLLIEELTVFQNLYFNARLCFKNKTEKELTDMVMLTLSNLGLAETHNRVVGSPLNKVISGGQRKRLNIALELIREPSVLFVDEPTSGLSSRDSENVMDLLRELTLKGKLVFVVIHQPSSDIYKMFDNMIILDVGGYMVYNGNPVDAVTYFKKIDFQINSDVGECQQCGNVNPELIFNIIDAKVVDEYGQYTPNRKILPVQWNTMYNDHLKKQHTPDISTQPPSSLSIPSKISQFVIYTIRDFLTKISNTQYIAMNLLVAPLLAFILAYIIRYIADPTSDLYIFRENENIPQYFFMAIVVSLFLGLIVSAEEIYKDRKILKREAFLNLSRGSYLFSKVLILFGISAIQTILFILVGNSILQVKGMNIDFFIALFSVSAFANLLGLNISSAFNSAVTIYILIPLLLIPQMILGGAMFSFDKLNRSLGSVEKVPAVAEFMAAKWAYEALMVNQFTNNTYNKTFYKLDKEQSASDYITVYLIPKLEENVNYCIKNTNMKDSKFESELAIIKSEVRKLGRSVALPSSIDVSALSNTNFTDETGVTLLNYLNKAEAFYMAKYNEAGLQKETILNYWLGENQTKFNYIKDCYYSETVGEVVKKVFEKNKIVRYQDKYIQQYNPIYIEPENDFYFGFRTHFYSPAKYLMGIRFDTFQFNMIFIWFMSVVLFITLQLDLFKRFVTSLENFRISNIIPKSWKNLSIPNPIKKK